MIKKALALIKKKELSPARNQHTKQDRYAPLFYTFRNDTPVIESEIVVLVPVAPNIKRQFINSTLYLVQRAAAPFRVCRLVFDSRGEPPPRGKPHPYRQTALANIRQRMVDLHLGSADWVIWNDADIVDYPASLFSDLVSRASGGIAAPVVLMDGELGDDPNDVGGFGAGKFFDIGGFVECRRWARFEEPWFNQNGPIYNLDSVGAIYAVSADIYRNGGKHFPDPFSLGIVEKGLDWDDDSIEKNQKGHADCFTEHYSICQWAIANGLPVRAFRDLVARHAQHR